MDNGSAIQRLWAWTMTRPRDWTWSRETHYTLLQIKTKTLSNVLEVYHDHFDPLCYRIGFVVLLLHCSGQMVELPDRMAPLTLAGQLKEQITGSIKETHTNINMSDECRKAVPLPPATGKHMLGRKSWTQSSWPRQTCIQSSTWFPTASHLQDTKQISDNAQQQVTGYYNSNDKLSIVASLVTCGGRNHTWLMSLQSILMCSLTQPLIWLQM